MSDDPLLNRMSPQGNGGAFAGDASFSKTELGRFSFPWRLVLEKVPLLALVAVSCVLTVWAQGEAFVSVEHLTLWWRIGNALNSYVAYLVQFFYPLGLAVFYPHPGAALPIWKVVGAAVALACISGAALACRRRCPYLLVGWLWYLGMLLPVIGLSQTGIQAMADRFTYLPQIGLCIALVWGVADMCRSWPRHRWVGSVMSVWALMVLMGCAWRQTSFWRDSQTLWPHTLACTSPNCVAHKNLGDVFLGQGRLEEAAAHYRTALEIEPRHADAHTNLGRVLARYGRWDEAIAQFRRVLEITDAPPAHYNLGVILAGRGHPDEALAHYRRAVELDPDFAEAHCSLGVILAGRGRFDEALAHYQRAVELDPDYAEARCNLGRAFARLGRFDEALAQYQKAVELKPNLAEAHDILGDAFLRSGRLDEAIAQYRKALKIRPDYAIVHCNLGNVLERLGRFDEAIAHYQKAAEIKPDDVVAHGKLAWLRATCPEASLRNGAEAVRHAQQANRLCGGKRPDVLDTLAAAYAEAGRIPEALATAHKALEVAKQQNAQAFADAVRTRIALYEAGKPFHQTSAPLDGPKTK